MERDGYRKCNACGVLRPPHQAKPDGRGWACRDRFSCSAFKLGIPGPDAWLGIRGPIEDDTGETPAPTHGVEH